jgi:hypothetical protein
VCFITECHRYIPYLDKPGHTEALASFKEEEEEAGYRTTDNEDSEQLLRSGYRMNLQPRESISLVFKIVYNFLFSAMLIVFIRFNSSYTPHFWQRS